MSIATARDAAPASAPVSLPDPASLSPRQQAAIDCARCGRHLGVHWRRLGLVTMPPAVEGFGPTTFELFACAPYCVRIKGRSWREEWGEPLGSPSEVDPQFDNGLETIRRVLDCLRRPDEELALVAAPASAGHPERPLNQTS